MKGIRYYGPKERRKIRRQNRVERDTRKRRVVIIPDFKEISFTPEDFYQYKDDNEES